MVMRAIRAGSAGGPEVLSLDELPVPEPGPGQVVVEVSAAGVNFIDVYHRSGVYPVEYPRVLGTEGAGVVVALGPDVTEARVGDRVAWADGSEGSYASHTLVTAASLVPVPDTLPLDLAAASLLQGHTAYSLATIVFPVSAGQDVLVHAGAGGVGRLLTQLATSLGARVLTTVSSATKERVSREAGAADVIRYDKLDDLAAQLPRIVHDRTGGAGVHTVFDGVGKDTFEASLASLRRYGGLALFGGASGQVAPVDPHRLGRAGSVYLTRPNVWDSITPRAALLSRSAEMFRLLADGTLRPQISARYPLAEAAQAHADLEGRATTGKIVLVP